MNISDIDNMSTDTNVILIYSTSELLRLFTLERIKKLYECPTSYCKKIVTEGEYKEARMNSLTVPAGSEYWIFEVDMTKRMDSTEKMDNTMKRVVKNLEVSATGVYVLYFSKYNVFKFAKQKLKDAKNVKCEDMYMAYLKQRDIIYLYENIVSKSNRMSDDMFDFVIKNYASDTDALFNLFNYLEGGQKVETKKDIISISGYGGNTIPRLVLELIDSKMSSDERNIGKDMTNDKVSTSVERGRKKLVKNRLDKIKDIAEDSNYSYIYTAMLNTIVGLCDLKILYLNGHLYKKTLDKNEIEGYDDMSISRGFKFWYRIHEIPMSYMLELRTLLEEKAWSCEMDFIRFLYKYYKNKG